jgi:glycosyltransferase involved in cell wall biosynthesis
LSPGRVSVIIIFLDAAPFLEEAVASVVRQSYRDWELILVDDGSTDGSSGIARTIAERHPRQVRYLDHPGHRNLGTGPSRNVGLAAAGGEFVGFLDADDVWTPAKLERQVGLLGGHPAAGLVYGSTEYWYSWNGPGPRRDYVKRTGLPSGTVLPPPALVRGMITSRIAVPAMSSGLARLSLVRRVGGFDESFRGLYEDQVYYAKLALAAPALAVDELWDRYRQHPGSLCTVSGEAAALMARGRFLEWLESYVEHLGIPDRALRHAIRIERWLVRYPSAAPLVDWRRRATLRLRRRLGLGIGGT